IANALYSKVRGWQRSNDIPIIGVLTLTRQYCRDTVAPDLLDRRQDPWLVVDQNIMARWITPLDVFKLFLLVDVDQHIAFHRLGNPGALDLARLKDDITIGEHDSRRPAAKVLEHIERSRVEPIGKRVVY